MNKLLSLALLMLSIQAFGQAASAISMQQYQALLSQQDDTLRVLNLWATWCKPCVMELPHFVKVQQALAGKPVRFYYISLDKPSDAERVGAFAKRLGLGSSVAILKKEGSAWFDWIDPAFDGAIPVTLLYRARPSYRVYFPGEVSEAELRNAVEEGL